MNAKLRLAILVVSVSIIWLFNGFIMGWIQRGRHNKEALREATREEFIRSITWAIESGLITVNSNKMSEILDSDMDENGVKLEGAEKTP